MKIQNPGMVALTDGELARHRAHAAEYARLAADYRALFE
jgi:hypothetical protein